MHHRYITVLPNPKGPLLLLLILSFGLGTLSLQAQNTRDYAVELTAEPTGAGLLLSWRGNANTQDYRLQRKDREDTSWTTLAMLPAGDTSYVDSTVQPGQAYEYHIHRRVGGGGGIEAHSYCYGGKHLAAAGARGKLLLLIDSTMRGPLSSELRRLAWDLRGDGWQPLRMTAHPSDSAALIRQQIQQLRQQHPSLRGIFILGEVPVPYSGNITPDGHAGNHKGAWPADGYYGELTGTWTDTSVNNTSSGNPRINNVPGDGKFDPSWLYQLGSPSRDSVELFVGRADFSDLPAFSASDTALLRRYLNKDHAFRQRQWVLPRRALAEDNFGTFSGEAFAANAFRNFIPMMGRDCVRYADYRSTLQQQAYLCSYGTGGGSYTSAGGITTTSNFAQDSLRTVFAFLFGSYFGDWDAPNNLLRAAIASGPYTLVSGWPGRPNWFIHSMALGEPVGRAFLTTMNNPYDTAALYRPTNYLPTGVHIGLMGDPTLQLFYPPTPGPLAAEVDSFDSSLVRLTWGAAQGGGGYHVYRAPHPDSLFQRLTAQPISDTSYTDSLPRLGKNYYMVRHRVLDSTASGTYYDLSQGVFDSTSFSPPCQDVTYIDSSFCFDEQLTIAGAVYDSSGVYRDTLTNQASCDSILQITLTTNRPDTLRIDTSFCQGKGVRLGNTTVAFDEGTDTLKYWPGLPQPPACQNVGIVTISHTGTLDSVQLDTIINNGDTLQFLTSEGPRNFTDAGTYTFTGRNPSPAICDSIVTLDLQVAVLDARAQPAGASERLQLRPNPLSAGQALQARLRAAPGKVALTLQDAAGRQRHAWQRKQSQQHQRYQLALPDGLAAGVYILRAQTPSGPFSRKLLLTR